MPQTPRNPRARTAESKSRSESKTPEVVADPATGPEAVPVAIALSNSGETLHCPGVGVIAGGGRVLVTRELCDTQPVRELIAFEQLVAEPVVETDGAPVLDIERPTPAPTDAEVLTDLAERAGLAEPSAEPTQVPDLEHVDEVFGEASVAAPADPPDAGDTEPTGEKSDAPPPNGESTDGQEA